MSFHSSSSREDRLSHFRNVVVVAAKDGEVADIERQLLSYIAAKWDLSKSDVDEVLSKINEIEFTMPGYQKDKFHQLYDLVEIMIIDGVMKRSEKDLCEAVAHKFGFSQTAVADIIEGILEGNRAGEDPDSIARKLEYRIR